MAELFGLRGSDNDFRLPQEFVTRREVGAVQLFGRNRIERIPPDAIILGSSFNPRKDDRSSVE